MCVHRNKLKWEAWIVEDGVSSMLTYTAVSIMGFLIFFFQYSILLKCAYGVVQDFISRTCERPFSLRSIAA